MNYRRTLLLTLALMLFASNAFAGGGPPQKFKDLKMVAEHI